MKVTSLTLVDDCLLESTRRVAQNLAKQHAEAKRAMATSKIQAWCRSFVDDLLHVLVKRTSSLMLALRAREEEARQAERKGRAVVSIQCAFRQYRDRNSVAKLKKRRGTLAEIRRGRCARKIQNAVRSTILLRRDAKAATLLQALMRRYLAVCLITHCLVLNNAERRTRRVLALCIKREEELARSESLSKSRRPRDSYVRYSSIDFDLRAWLPPISRRGRRGVTLEVSVAVKTRRRLANMYRVRKDNASDLACSAALASLGRSRYLANRAEDYFRISETLVAGKFGWGSCKGRAGATGMLLTLKLLDRTNPENNACVGPFVWGQHDCTLKNFHIDISAARRRGEQRELEIELSAGRYLLARKVFVFSMVGAGDASRLVVEPFNPHNDAEIIGQCRYTVSKEDVRRFLARFSAPGVPYALLDVPRRGIMEGQSSPAPFELELAVILSRQLNACRKQLETLESCFFRNGKAVYRIYSEQLGKNRIQDEFKRVLPQFVASGERQHCRSINDKVRPRVKMVVFVSRGVSADSDLFDEYSDYCDSESNCDSGSDPSRLPRLSDIVQPLESLVHERFDLEATVALDDQEEGKHSPNEKAAWALSLFGGGKVQARVGIGVGVGVVVARFSERLAVKEVEEEGRDNNDGVRFELARTEMSPMGRDQDVQQPGEGKDEEDKGAEQVEQQRQAMMAVLEPFRGQEHDGGGEWKEQWRQQHHEDFLWASPRRPAVSLSASHVESPRSRRRRAGAGRQGARPRSKNQARLAKIVLESELSGSIKLTSPRGKSGGGGWDCRRY